MSQLFTLPFQTPFQSSAPIGLARLYFFAAGTTTHQPVYTTAALTTAHDQPVRSSADGTFPPIFLNPNASADYRIQLKTADDVLVTGGDVDNIPRRELSQTEFNAYLSLSDPYKRTAAEIAAGVTPVNYAYEPLNALRYGTNTTPGTTDMTTAIQAAINVALQNGGIAYIPAGAYKITASLVPGVAAFTNIRIRGDGPLTQIINACSANKPSFVGSAVSGWSLEDLWFTGNSANPNHGVYVDGTSPISVRFNISRVWCNMAGVGFYLKNVNTYTVTDCKSWPSGQTPQIAQTVTPTDIDHHMYLTGGYAHDGTIKDFDAMPLSTYKAGQCGIKCDTTSTSSLRIIGGLFQCDNNTRYGLDLYGLIASTVIGNYTESALNKIDNCAECVFQAIGNGGTAGSIEVGTGSVNNTFIACNVAVFTASASSTYNTFIGCNFPSLTDSAVPRNTFINCGTPAGRIQTSIGTNVRKRITYSASITPNYGDANTQVINVSNGTAFTINAPTNGWDGARLTIVIRNAFGAMGAITWNAIYHMSAWTNPAVGNYRAVTFEYDSDDAAWHQISATGTDIAS